MALEEELLGVTQEPKAGRSGDHSAPEDALGDKDPRGSQLRWEVQNPWPVPSGPTSES